MGDDEAMEAAAEELTPEDPAEEPQEDVAADAAADEVTPGPEPVEEPSTASPAEAVEATDPFWSPPHYDLNPAERLI